MKKIVFLMFVVFMIPCIIMAQCPEYDPEDPDDDPANYPVSLSIHGWIVAEGKIYDGNKTATLSDSDFELVFTGGNTPVSDIFPNCADVYLCNIVYEFDNVGPGEDITVRIVSADLCGGDAGYYVLTLDNSPTWEADILKRPLILEGTFDVSNKTYNADVDADISNDNVDIADPDGNTGIVGTEDVEIDEVIGEFADKNVGNDKVVNILKSTLTGTDAGNYYIMDGPTETADITPKDISITGTFTAESRPYDCTVEADIDDDDLELSGVEDDDVDDVNLVAVGEFEDANVGNDKAVNLLASSLSGDEKGNYNLIFPEATTPTATANITHRQITLSGSFVASPRPYDGSTDASIGANNIEIEGIVCDEDVDVNFIANFADANVGTHTVSLNNSTLIGEDISNYELDFTDAPTDNASIILKQLTIGGTFTAEEKTYDGGLTATIDDNQLELVGIVEIEEVEEDVSLSNVVIEFVNANVGDPITVTIISAQLDGDDKDNYTINYAESPTTTAAITPKELTIGGSFTANDRTYNGGFGASIDVDNLELEGKVGTDVVNLEDVVVTFEDKDVGTHTVNITSADITGPQAPNYTLSLDGAPTDEADINAREIYLTGGFSVSEKTYDGTINATIDDDNLILNNIVSGEEDDVTLNAVARFITPDVGENKPVNLLASTLGGTASGNYTLDASSPTTTANITKKTLTIDGAFTVEPKTYDRNVEATIVEGPTFTLELVGVENDDDVTPNWVAEFVDMYASNDPKTVNLGESYLTGDHADNYELDASEPTTTALINRKNISIIGTLDVLDKTYDGNNDAAPGPENSLSLDGVILPDVVNLTAIILFDDEDVGEDKDVTISETSSLGGANAGNYNLTFPPGTPTTTANITHRELTIGLQPGQEFTVQNKTYDATVAATIIGNPADIFTLNNIVLGEEADVTLSAEARFIDANVGENITVNLEASTLGGTASGNYTLDASSPTTTANITKKTLTIDGAFTVEPKTYDRNVEATIVEGPTFTLELVGVENDDDVTPNWVAEFVDRHASDDPKTVNLLASEISGEHADNYELDASEPTTTALINRKDISITGTLDVHDKTYDGNNNAAPGPENSLSLDGVISPDVVNLTAIILFDDEDVGEDKDVTISETSSLGGADAGNYNLTFPVGTTPTTTADITHRELTIGLQPEQEFSVHNKTYDATDEATIIGDPAEIFTLNNIVEGEQANVTLNPIAEFNNANVGNNKPVNLQASTLGGSASGNYTLDASSPTTTANITKKTLTIDGAFTVEPKTYDRNVEATIAEHNLTLNGVEPGDNVTPNWVAEFVDRHASDDPKTVNLLASEISGDHAGNYELDASLPTTTALINRKDISISGTLDVLDKTYDGNTNAAFGAENDLELDGVISPDVVNLTAIAEFENKHVGLEKNVTISESSSLGGAAANNYNLTFPIETTPNTTAHITHRQLTIGGSFVTDDKVYDGETTAPMVTNNLTLINLVSGEETHVSLTNVVIDFEQAEIGEDLDVSITSADIEGEGYIHNYNLSLAGAPIQSANITAKTIYIIGEFDAHNKIYDRTFVATITEDTENPIKLDGVEDGHDVELNIVPRFDDRNVGEGIEVNLSSSSITGTHSSNYSLSFDGAPTATANIDKKPLEVDGTFTALNKTYNGNTNASINANNLTLPDVISPDNVNLNPILVFDTKDAGENKTVFLSGTSTVTGDHADNYELVIDEETPTALATINKRELTIGGDFTALDKYYDKTNTATIDDDNLELVNKIGEEDVNLIDVELVFAQVTVGEDITVSITSADIDGDDAINYTLSITGAPTTEADINPKPLTITNTFNVSNKVYDGNTSATITNPENLQLFEIEDGDFVTLIPIARFASKDIGTNIDVDLSQIETTLGGADADNYIINFTGAPSTQANITAKELRIGGSFSVNSKTYDGGTTATFGSESLSLIGVVGGEDVNLSNVVINFASPNVGNGIAVNITSAQLSGTETGNYTLDHVTEAPVAAANITAKQLTISGGFQADGRPYDGTINATITADPPHTLSLVGVEGADDVTLVPVARFDNKHVGVDKPVDLLASSLDGTAASNYSLDASSPAATATITQKELTIGGSFSVANKTYDASTDASITVNELTLIGVETGDVVDLDAVANFNNPDVGTGKPVNLDASTISGANYTDYYLSTDGSPTTTANITGKTVTIEGSFTAEDKIYDGETDAIILANELVLVGVEDDDVGDVELNAIADFINQFVGDNKQVRLFESELTGEQSDNYIISFTGAPTAEADITQKELTIEGSFGVEDRAYNGNTDATINLPHSLTLNGIVSGDEPQVSLNAVANFNNADVAENKPVNINSSTLAGGLAYNYSLSFTDAPSTTAEIYTKALTIDGSFTVSDKTYDGNAEATITANSLSLVGIITSDIGQVELDPVAARFDNPNVGTNKEVSLFDEETGISGDRAFNYHLDFTGAPVTYANITQLELTIGGSFSANDKEYDGNVSATFEEDNLVLETVINPDDVILNAVIKFEDELMGESKEVYICQIETEISGLHSDNYNLSFAGELPVASADITQRVLTIEGTFTIHDKFYDGTTEAFIDENNLYLVQPVENENVSLSNLVFEFEQAEVGNDITVNITNADIVGDNINNYLLSTEITPTSSANILGRSLIVSAENKSKTYGQDDPEFTVTYHGFIEDEDETDLTGALSFIREPGEIVGTYDITPEGLSSDNYAIFFLDGILTINKKELSIGGEFTVYNKINDGTVSAIINQNNLTLDGIESGDDVYLHTNGIIAEFEDASIGVGKTVNITEILYIVGNDAFNYSVTLDGAPATTESIYDPAVTPLAITSTGDFINYGVFTHGNRGIAFTGNTVQTIRTNNSPFYNIEFYNTNTGNADIVVEDDLLVTNFANFERGIVNTGANRFIFGEDAGTTIGNETSFIDGIAEKINCDDPFTFPVGNVNNRDITGEGAEDYRIWAPIEVSPEGPTNVDVRYRFSNEGLYWWWYHNWSHEEPLTHTSDREYWTVNSGEDATITLHWKNNEPCYIHDLFDEDNFLHESLTIAYWDNKWYDASPFNTPQGTVENGFITTSFPIPFGSKGGTQITFGGKDSEIPLPITLLSFDAECAGNTAVISWVTASEYNNEYFILEKSNDAKSFVKVAKIDGAGYSNKEILYVFNDEDLFEGDNYYRLIQVDYDGTFEVFNIIHINCEQYDKNEPTVLIYPNPFRSEITVLLENFEENEVIFEIYDELGKLVYIEKYKRSERSDKHTIELNNLNPAMYNFRTRTNKHLFNNKIIKQ